jgi:hypothetical protein
MVCFCVPTSSSWLVDGVMWSVVKNGELINVCRVVSEGQRFNDVSDAQRELEIDRPALCQCHPVQGHGCYLSLASRMLLITHQSQLLISSRAEVCSSKKLEFDLS